MRSSFQGAGEQLAKRLQQDGINNAKVLQAIAQTPRHLFVGETLSHRAYENTALPIGDGQTISQPYIVAKMTELLLAHGVTGHVLEIGTGCGYQTAILAQLVEQVSSIERLQKLQYQAKRRLKSLDLYNINTRHGDGWQGWQSKAPFDGIIVTAAAEHVPEQLLQQLSDGGVLIIPVGTEQQVLRLIQRQQQQFKTTDICAVRFVPLIPGDLA